MQKTDWHAQGQMEYYGCANAIVPRSRYPNGTTANEASGNRHLYASRSWPVATIVAAPGHQLGSWLPVRLGSQGTASARSTDHSLSPSSSSSSYLWLSSFVTRKFHYRQCAWRGITPLKHSTPSTRSQISGSSPTGVESSWRSARMSSRPTSSRCPAAARHFKSSPDRSSRSHCEESSSTKTPSSPVAGGPKVATCRSCLIPLLRSELQSFTEPASQQRFSRGTLKRGRWTRLPTRSSLRRNGSRRQSSLRVSLPARLDFPSRRDVPSQARTCSPRAYRASRL